MKDPEDVEKCEALFRNHFTDLQVFYLKWLAQSKKYPEIDEKMLFRFIQNIADNYEKYSGESFNMDSNKIMVMYISSTRNDRSA